MSFVNQYSFLLTAIVCIGALGFLLLRKGVRTSDLIALASLTLGFVVAYQLLRPGPSTSQQADQVLEQIGAGAPVLLELQSPFCLGCMAARPVVDGIEREHPGRLTVIRLNVQDPVGRAIASRFDFRFTPTFLFFDAQGQERWRTVGAVDPRTVRQSLAAP